MEIDFFPEGQSALGTEMFAQGGLFMEQNG